MSCLGMSRTSSHAQGEWIATSNPNNANFDHCKPFVCTPHCTILCTPPPQAPLWTPLCMSHCEPPSQVCARRMTGERAGQLAGQMAKQVAGQVAGKVEPPSPRKRGGGERKGKREGETASDRASGRMGSSQVAGLQWVLPMQVLHLLKLHNQALLA